MPTASRTCCCDAGGFGRPTFVDEPGGWRFRFAKDGPGLFYAVDVTRCGIVRFLTAEGAPELAPLLCGGDYQIGKYLPPGVTFQRTQVIAEGAPFCDFRYLNSTSPPPKMVSARPTAQRGQRSWRGRAMVASIPAGWLLRLARLVVPAGGGDDGRRQDHPAEHAQYRGGDARVVVDIGLQHGLAHGRDQEGDCDHGEHRRARRRARMVSSRRGL